MAMKRSMKAACICLMGCLSVACSAQEGDFEDVDVKDGFYLGGMFVHNGMSGDFDNTTYYVSSDAVYDVPDVDDGTGFGVLVGWREGRTSLEIGYQRTTHDTFSSFEDIGDSEASYNVVDLNLKVDVFAQNKLRPYILLGAGIPWLTVKDSMSEGINLDDETFIGFCLDLGAGVAYYFHPQWAVTGGFIYRWNWFTSVEGDSLDDNLSENALGLTVGLAYTF